MPTLEEMGKMIQTLEEVKNFGHGYNWIIIKQKMVRLNDEVKEALEEIDNLLKNRGNIPKEAPDKIVEELIDCIFFICSALHKIEKLTGINPDEKFLWKFDKNILRERNPNGLDTFGD